MPTITLLTARFMMVSFSYSRPIEFRVKNELSCMLTIALQAIDGAEALGNLH